MIYHIKFIVHSSYFIVHRSGILFNKWVSVAYCF